MKPKILAIDDEKSMRLLLSSFLGNEKIGYEVVCMEDGVKALEELESNLPDLIICDVQMPNMDGYTFLQKLRERAHTKNTPVVMLSGVDTSKERVKCYKLGAQDFLQKPFNPEELHEIVKKNLNPIHYNIKW